MSIAVDKIRTQGAALGRGRNADVAAGLLRALSDEDLRRDVRDAVRSARHALGRLASQISVPETKRRHRRRTAALIAAGIAGAVVASKVTAAHASPGA